LNFQADYPYTKRRSSVKKKSAKKKPGGKRSRDESEEEVANISDSPLAKKGKVTGA
jgi:hypothetical protein